jgi:ATP-dependent DNA ligase
MQVFRMDSRTLWLGVSAKVRPDSRLPAIGTEPLPQAFRHACRMGLDGIVPKRRDRPYRSRRSADWIKVKNPDAPAASRMIEG